MPICYEFRGFVHNKKLTALSQYFDSVYFPQVVSCSAQIVERIQQFFETTLKNLLPFDNAVVDFLADPLYPSSCY